MKTKPFQQWRRVAGEARTRIVIWCAILMALSMLVAILAIRWLLFARIDARVREDLVAEVEIFTTKIAAKFGMQSEALPPLQGEQKAIAQPSS